MTFGQFNEFEIRMAQMFGHPFGQNFEELCMACMKIYPKAQGILCGWEETPFNGNRY